MSRAPREVGASPAVAPGPSVGSLPLIERHLVVGWALILGFLILGMALEALHGFKIGWYVDLSSSIRRLMFTLAHAHGVLLGLVNIAFAATVAWVPSTGKLRGVSGSLVAASILLPGGFLLGGLGTHGGDPGAGVLLTPVGALLLLLVAWLVLRNVRAASRRTSR